MPASSPSTPTATRPSRSTRLPRFIPISKTEMLVLKVDESTTESPTSSPSSRRDALARIQDHMMENPTNEQLVNPLVVILLACGFNLTDSNLRLFQFDPMVCLFLTCSPNRFPFPHLQSRSLLIGPIMVSPRMVMW